MKQTVVYTTQMNTPPASVIRAYYELTKPGITYMVLASMAIGFVLGSTSGFDFVSFFHAALGTFLIAGGTAAHNQYMERQFDKLMVRTARRPLPSFRIKDRHALAFSVSMIVLGLVYLIFNVNFAAGLVSLATSFIYLVLYTPLKQVSFWNVPIGSVAGALPPVGGWAAASGTVTDPGMWILFAIVFLWQVPHVLAIAWLCNEDYTKAGFHMLPEGDRSGLKTAWYSTACLIGLIPAVVVLYLLDYNTMYYLIPAVAATLWFIFQGIRFLYERSTVTARKLMFASFFYLPIIWIIVLIDKLVF